MHIRGKYYEIAECMIIRSRYTEKVLEDLYSDVVCVSRAYGMSVGMDLGHPDLPVEVVLEA